MRLCWKKLAASSRLITKLGLLSRLLLLTSLISTTIFIFNLHQQWNPRTILRLPITEQSIFTYSAFILPSYELHVITIRSCRNKDLVSAVIHLLNHTTVKLDLRSEQIAGCSETDPCYFHGHLFNTVLPSNYDPNEKIELQIVNSSRSISIVPTIISSLPSKRPHRMVACIQPMFLFIDWITLVQHIETYLQIGVTKFFIYVQTVSPEVDLILKIYQDAGIVELMPWAMFPYSEPLDSLNVNNFVYRADMVTAVNDCLLRVRPLADFALFTDVDEIISSLSSNVSLIDLVEKEFSSSQSKTTAVGSLMFRSATVRVPPIKDEQNFDASSVPFEYLRRIEHEGGIWKAGAMSKILLRTDATHIMHVHSVGQFEHGKRWTNKVVNETEGLVFHFRRPNSTFYPKTKLPTIQEGLADYASKAQARWKQRIVDKYSNGGLTLPYYAQSVLQLINDCVQKDLYPRMGKFCMAPPIYCLKVSFSPFTNQSLTFVHAENTWLVL